jgi:hypothetical protein
MRFLFFTTICFVVIISCSSSKILRLYPEPPLLSSETARLHRIAGEYRYRSSSKCIFKLRIKGFDGKEPSGSDETLEFLPGSQSVTVDFPGFMTGGLERIDPKHPIEIHFDAKAGGEYILGCGTNYRSGEWTAGVHDMVTGAKVSD